MARMDPPSTETAALLAAVSKPIDAQGAAVTGQPASAPVTPEDVDPRYLAMLLAFEDRRFYSHIGVDPYALTRAGFEFVRYGRIISGGSTLTMQVARILDNNFKRSTSVKVRQIIHAIALESRFTKREILTLYLNLAPFGGKIKGVRAAALTISERRRSSFRWVRRLCSSPCRRHRRRAASTAISLPPAARAISY